MTKLDHWLVVTSFAGAIGSGLIGGVFYAFSTFVMRALGRLPPAEGMAAMRAINVAVINPLFLGVFLGTAAVCAAGAVGGIGRWGRAGAGYLVAGAVLYFVGTFLVTVVFNVPLNNALAAVTPNDPEAPERWANYLSRWTVWNHVRTASAVAATFAFILALHR